MTPRLALWQVCCQLAHDNTYSGEVHPVEGGVEAEDGVGSLNFHHRAKRSTRCSLSNHLTEQFRSRLWDDYRVGK